MFYEIRHYQTKPGRREQWVRYMEEVVITLYAATHDDPRWTEEIFPAVADLLLLDRTVVTRAVPTAASALH